jgi:hypothetical protein
MLILKIGGEIILLAVWCAIFFPLWRFSAPARQ